MFSYLQEVFFLILRYMSPHTHRNPYLMCQNVRSFLFLRSRKESFSAISMEMFLLFSTGNCLVCALGSIFPCLMRILTSVFIFSESGTLVFYLSIDLCVYVVFCFLCLLFFIILTLYIYKSASKNLPIFYLIFALHSYAKPCRN